MRSSLPKFARWAIFTVALALVPLVVASLALVTYSRQFSLNALTEHGELLLIATAIGGGAMGELIAPRTKNHPIRKIICGGTTLICVLTSAMWFVIISLGTGWVNPQVVSYGSLVLLAITIFSSGGCIILSEA